MCRVLAVSLIKSAIRSSPAAVDKFLRPMVLYGSGL